MCEFRPPVAAFSAGATTSANKAGPTSGTAIWRGLWAVSAARRAASVRSARPMDVRGGAATGRGASAAGSARVVDMGSVLSDGLSGGGGHAGAGQPQVDVVEGRLAAADGAGAQPRLGDRRDGVAGAGVVQRHGQRLPDDVRVGGGDAMHAQRVERDRGVAVDAQLEE